MSFSPSPSENFSTNAQNLSQFFSLQKPRFPHVYGLQYFCQSSSLGLSCLSTNPVCPLEMVGTIIKDPRTIALIAIKVPFIGIDQGPRLRGRLILRGSPALRLDERLCLCRSIALRPRGNHRLRGILHLDQDSHLSHPSQGFPSQLDVGEISDTLMNTLTTALILSSLRSRA